MTIDPRALRTYLVVCKEGSITAAANKLNISQPAVSVTIRQLETALGVTLFGRSRSGIILSPAGEVLLHRAEALESLLQRAEEEVALVQQAITGPFRVGGTPGAVSSLAPILVQSLDRQQSRYSMEVVELTDGGSVEALRNNELDLAMLTTGIEAVPDDLQEWTLVRDPFSLVVGQVHANLPDELPLDEMASMRWVLPAASGAFQRQITALFVSANIALPRDVIRCDSLLATKAILRTSNYVTILPNGLIESELAAETLRAIKIANHTIERRIGIRALKQGERRPVVQALIERLGLE